MQLLVRDVATLLNVSEKTVYRWIGQGEIPVYRVNKQYRFSRVELLEWASSRRVNVSPALLAEPPGQDGAVPVTATDALEEGGIIYRVEGTDRDSVLRALVATLRLPGDMDREALLQFLVAREELGSTAVGGGIALPHVRNPIVLNISRPTVTLAFLEKPVEFGALDGEPVRCLFTLISPSVRSHLALLARLSFMLRNPDFRSVVDGQAPRTEILAGARAAEASIVARPTAPVAPAGG